MGNFLTHFVGQFFSRKLDGMIALTGGRAGHSDGNILVSGLIGQFGCLFGSFPREFQRSVLCFSSQVVRSCLTLADDILKGELGAGCRFPTVGIDAGDVIVEHAISVQMLAIAVADDALTSWPLR